MNSELRKKTAKRVAPNEPTHRARGRPGMGRGRKDEVQSTKDEKERSCGIEEVVSGHFSVVSRLFSGDPQGSTFELRNADFGLRIQRSEPGAQATGYGSRTTNHEPRTSQNLSGRTKPFRRKTNATKAKRHDWRTMCSVRAPGCCGAARQSRRDPPRAQLRPVCEAMKMQRSEVLQNCVTGSAQDQRVSSFCWT